MREHQKILALFFRDRREIRTLVSGNIAEFTRLSRPFNGEFDFISGMHRMRTAFIYQKCYGNRSVKIIQLINAIIRVVFHECSYYDVNYVSRIYIINATESDKRNVTLAGFQHWFSG